MTDATEADTTRKLSEIFDRDEIRMLTARSDLRGALAIAANWGLVALAFVGLARFPHPVTFAVAVIVIAGRQLGLAILQHEGSHRTLFRTRWLNDVATDWLCARPVWQHLPKYRAHHLRHHAHTGTEADPDATLHVGFPTTRRSMARKLLRDALGLTGLKTLVALILMDAGIIQWTVANDAKRLPQAGRAWHDYPVTFLKNAFGMLLTNAVLFGILAASGHAWLYAAWVVAFFTPMPLFVRIRSIAEHGCVPRVADVLQNTRSTRAGLLLRLTVAPNGVNYHIEHHLVPAIPYYRLRDAHRLLADRHLVPESPSYREVLTLASSG